MPRVNHETCNNTKARDWQSSDIPEDTVDKLVDFFKVMADRNRFRIVLMLLEHPHCVNALARKLDIGEAAVSQHLRILRLNGLVEGKKDGLYVHYRIKHVKLQELFGELHSFTNRKQKEES